MSADWRMSNESEADKKNIHKIGLCDSGES